MKGTKGNCPVNFIVLWSKLLNYLTKNLFSNMRLLLQSERVTRRKISLVSDLSKEEQIICSSLDKSLNHLDKSLKTDYNYNLL